MITVKKNEQLFGHEKEYDAVIVTSDLYSVMQNGYSYFVGTMFPYAFDANMATKYGDRRKLGTIIEAKQRGQPTFIFAFILVHRMGGIYKDESLSYEAVESCLKTINVLYKGKRIASMFIGASDFDGRGNRRKLMRIFRRTTNDIDWTIYDGVQLSSTEMYFMMRKELRELKEKDPDAYYRKNKKRKEIAKKIKAMNGRRGGIAYFEQVLKKQKEIIENEKKFKSKRRPPKDDSVLLPTGE